MNGLEAAPPIRTIIIDDHPVVRFGIRHILESVPDIDLVADLENLDNIESVMEQHQPDVILLDLELGDQKGAGALQKLGEICSGTNVIVYTAHEQEQYVVQAASIGVRGYLLKGSPKEKLVNAVRDVHAGGTWIEPSVAATLMKHLNREKKRQSLPDASFSKREKQVLELIANGKTNRSIGDALCISESTVKFHVHAILSKLKAKNRTEAVSQAMQIGLIAPPTTREGTSY